MLTRTEGIVLKTQKYGEADLIATYLTSDKGIINAFAKSPRKTKSRFGSSLEPLTHAKISLWGKEQALPRITQSDIADSFRQIRENYRDFVNISKLVEILISLTPVGIPNKRLFSFFLNILHIVKSSEHELKDALHLITRIRLLAVIGYAPRLKGCGKCGEKSLDFYPDSGTTLCTKCAVTPDRAGKPFMRINNKVIHFYTHSIEWPINISNRLKPGRETLSGLSGLLDKHLTYLLSKKLRSSEFFSGTAAQFR
ncbi:MAG TPA: DNA repair protein RecO [Nitrospirae bacterium]|nr:DNA repair protein RecO [bacterium BMS3Abin06]HDH10642.1 DNA repair protein RecO [Nitrospirota bacterium]HDZ02345.1 DNA repair protein RecO [Nitrospirota bacterium]